MERLYYRETERAGELRQTMTEKWGREKWKEPRSAESCGADGGKEEEY
jgi:hypothetical protein